MKFKFSIALAALLCFAGISQAQSVTNETTLDKIIGITGGITNVSIDVYGTYAPKGQAKVGGGLFVIYDVNPTDLMQVGLGIGADWLGDWSLVNGNVSIKMPFHPLSAYPTLEMSPIVLVGVGTAYSGGGNFNGALSVVSDAGLAMNFGHLWGGQFNAAVLWGRWQGSGPNDVARYHLALGWQHGF